MSYKYYEEMKSHQNAVDDSFTRTRANQKEERRPDGIVYQG